MTFDNPHAHGFHLRHPKISQAMLRKWPTSGSCRPWFLAFYVKKRRERRREREVWERDWLQRRWGKGALRQLMAELRLEDEERVTESICGWTPRHLWGKKFFPKCYPKCFCCLDQVSYNRFNKKSRGTDIFGLCFVNMTSRELCCWKTIFRCLISACLHCLWQKNTLTLGST